MWVLNPEQRLRLVVVVVVVVADAFCDPPSLDRLSLRQDNSKKQRQKETRES